MPAQRDQEAPERDVIRHARITDSAEKYGIVGPQLIEPIFRHHATGLGVGLAAPVEFAPLKRETIAARRRLQRLDAFRYDLAPYTVAGDDGDPICPGHRLPPLCGSRLASFIPGCHCERREAISLPLPSIRWGLLRRSASRNGTGRAVWLFVHVPDVRGELPLAAHLSPHHDIFAGDLLRRLRLCLEAERADLACRAGPERLDMDGRPLGVAQSLPGAPREVLDWVVPLCPLGPG